MGHISRDQVKIRYRKGLWSPDEDQKLKDYLLKHGHDCWSAVAVKAGKLLSSSPRKKKLFSGFLICCLFSFRVAAQREELQAAVDQLFKTRVETWALYS